MVEWDEECTTPLNGDAGFVSDARSLTHIGCSDDADCTTRTRRWVARHFPEKVLLVRHDHFAAISDVAKQGRARFKTATRGSPVGCGVGLEDGGWRRIHA